jgi:hypothetical protein
MSQLCAIDMFQPGPLAVGADFFALELDRDDDGARKSEWELGVGAAGMGVKRLPKVV